MSAFEEDENVKRAPLERRRHDGTNESPRQVRPRKEKEEIGGGKCEEGVGCAVAAILIRVMRVIYVMGVTCVIRGCLFQ